jgi:hypothetical protein
MHHYCTLFDKNYLLYGLALHASLLQQSGPFRLYMLAMDATCEAALRALALEHVVVVSLDEVITPEFAFVREKMSFGQMCWTCQPLLCRNVLSRPGIDEVTYLEADSYFFGDPQVLFDVVGSRSVSLVPHHYAPGHDQSATSGVYCVQFNLFRNDAEARELLDDWQQACLQYDKSRSGYYPGQLCLDRWPSRSAAVCVIENRGAGVAPWNVERYRVAEAGGKPTVDGTPVIFYHFHELSFTDGDGFYLSSYPLPDSAVRLVYQPYLRALVEVRRRLHAVVPGFDHCKSFRSPGLWSSLASMDYRRLRSYARYLYLAMKGRKNFVRLPS